MSYTQDVQACLKDGKGYGLGDAAYSNYLKKADVGLDRVRADYTSGRLPLLQLPERDDDLAGILKTAAILCDGASDVVVLGVGGSSLGAQTLAQIAGFGIPGRLQNQNPHIHFFDNLDPLTFAQALTDLPLETTRVLAVSKSGSTAETMMQLMTTLQAIKASGAKGALENQVILITIPEASPLRELGEREGFLILDHDPGIGGRFSVLSNVGLLPAALFGIDIGKIRTGAANVMAPILSGADASQSSAATGAAVALGLEAECAIRTNVLLSYSDRLRLFGGWYAQLWAESLGKDGRGTLPFGAMGPVDQHSQLQLYLGGPNDKFHTVVMTDCAGKGPKVSKGDVSDERLDYLAGKTIGDLVDAQQRATAETLIRNERPTRIMTIGEVSEESLGALLMHFMMETIIAGHMLGLNPFDQPAVEEGKILARQYLGEA